MRQPTRKPKNHGPIALTANVCTEGTMPLRTMNVPNTTSRKAMITNPKFQALSRTRRSWIWHERDNHQPEVPAPEPAAPLLDLRRVQVCGGGQPRHQRHVFDWIPSPVAA